MARPKPDVARDRHVTITVSDKERDLLHKKAKKQDMTLAQVGRKLLFAWLKEKA